MAHQSSRDNTLAAGCSVMRRRTGSQQLVAPLRVDLSACKYELLRLVASWLGWQVVPAGSADSAWDLFWTDTSISQERLLRLAPTQRINHFHGMLELCRKRSMAKALTALAGAAPATACYDFFPPTWQLPNQLGEFLAAAKAAGKKSTFILKPDAGCQGKGIRLVQGGSDKSVLRSLAGMTTLQAVAQAYLQQPYLVNGLKFDLRVYVLVADVAPLRLYIYKEGLVRFCTAPYKKPTSKNLTCAYMHLTNYAINKHNTQAFVTPGSAGNSSSKGAGHVGAGSSDDDLCSDESCDRERGGQQHAADASSKWSFSQLRQHLESQGHSWNTLWSAVGQLVVKSLLAVAPQLAATYRSTVVNSSRPGGDSSAICTSPRSCTSSGSSSASVSSAAVAAAACRCFEILGFDVLLDATLKPWLIEVNHSPSFNIDSALDKSIKGQLVMDAVRLVRIEPVSFAAAKKAARKATQARLVAPPPARGSSLADIGLCGAAGVCTADTRAAQQAHREAVIAARDKWQLKHLGGFERLYPVHMPGAQQQSPCGSGTVCSPAKLQELAELQETYDQLLAISQKVHQQRQHQQQSPIKVPTVAVSRDGRDWAGSLEKCPANQEQQQQQQLAGSNCVMFSNSSKHKLNEKQQQTGSKTPAKVTTDDSEEDDCTSQTCCTSPPTNIDKSGQVTVESAIALLSAALASPDRGSRNTQMQRRPSSAGGRQCSSSTSSSIGPSDCRPQPAVGGSRRSCSRPHSAAGGYTTGTTTSSSGIQHGADAAFTSMAGQDHVTSQARSSSTSTPKHLQRATCAASPHVASPAPAVRHRPASAPRLRMSSADATCSAASSAIGGESLLDKVRPHSSSSGRSCTLGVSSMLMHDIGCARTAEQSPRSAAPAGTAVTSAALEKQSSKQDNRQSSTTAGSTGGSRTAHGRCGNTAASTALVPNPLAPVEGACSGSRINNSCSSMLQPSGKVIAAAIVEATAALDWAVSVAAGEAAGRGAGTPRAHCPEHVEPCKIHSNGVGMNSRSSLIQSSICHEANMCLVGSLHGQSSKGKSLASSVLYSSSKVATAASLQCHPTTVNHHERGTTNVLIRGDSRFPLKLQQLAASSHASQRCSTLAGGTSCLERISSFPSRTCAAAACTYTGNSTTCAGSGLYQLQLGTAQVGELLSSSKGSTETSKSGTATMAALPKQEGAGAPTVQLYKQQQLQLLPVRLTQQHDACSLPQQLHSEQHSSTGSASMDAGDPGLVSVAVGLGQRRLLRHCSTGGLLGRLRLRDTLG